MDGDRHTYPKAGDSVKVHYIGRLLKDDFVFDSSREKGTPFEFTIGKGSVIEGWDEGVMKMSLGERAILQVPSNKAYGAQGAGGVIPPEADLYFDVELLAINGKEAPAKKEPEKGLPEQGYEGKPVEHKNMESCTEDWGAEYGPKKTGPSSKKEEEEKPEEVKAPKKSNAVGSSPWAVLT